MLFNMSYYFGISIVLIIVIVIFLFIWRKINEGELYIKVLEKKITNLKKENNVFRDMIDKQCVNSVSMEMAENIMSDIFGDDKKCQDDKCDIENKEDDVRIEEVVSDEIKQDDDIELDKLEEDIETIFTSSENEYSKSALLKMNVDRLKEICKELKLSNVGTKNNLIERILSR